LVVVVLLGGVGFAIRKGRVQERFVTLADGKLSEILDTPSSPAIERRLVELGLTLAEGHCGEMNLALDDWTEQVCNALDRGFVLTVDYGGSAAEVYGPANSDGTLVCYRNHIAGNDPLEHLGEQDITCHVDFTSLIRAGERHGLTTVGYARQRDFLYNLGFEALVHRLDAQDVSEARKALERMALMTLVDPDEYGSFRVLAQAKGLAADVELRGFSDRRVDAS
jgi:SAM-dependent MidA family methyltransferase